MDATSRDHEAILGFFKGSLEVKCEGIMVKVLDNSAERAGQEELLLGGSEGNVDKQDKGKAKASGKEKWGGRRKALLATYEPDKRLEVIQVGREYPRGIYTYYG